VLLCCRLGREEIMRPRRQWLALLCGPSTSPLEAAARTAQEDESTYLRRARAKNLRSASLLVRARWWPAQAAAKGDACGFGLRSLPGARTVTSMGATSNNRWSARAVSFGEARCVSMVWIKCLRSAPQRPRDAQLHR
jgi:hypothetical protein